MFKGIIMIINKSVCEDASANGPVVWFSMSTTKIHGHIKIVQSYDGLPNECVLSIR